MQQDKQSTKARNNFWDKAACGQLLLQLVETSANPVVLLLGSSEVIYANESASSIPGIISENRFLHPYRVNSTTRLLLKRQDRSEHCLDIHAVQADTETGTITYLTIKDAAEQVKSVDTPEGWSNFAPDSRAAAGSASAGCTDNEDPLHHDLLTDLPNRSFCREMLEEAVYASRDQNRPIGLILLDIDDFTIVNDGFGHDAGDLVLKEISRRLRRLLGSEDFIGRMSGDEFLLVLRRLQQTQDLQQMTEKIIEELSAPFAIDSTEIFVTVSIGLSTGPEHGSDGSTLLKSADAALRAAKAAGKNSSILYRPELTAQTDERLMLENGIRRALERNEFVLYYQPCLDMTTYKVNGYEALIRWQHPELGLLMPGRFIPLAEQRGLIESIDEWVIMNACRQAVEWQQSVGRLRLSVNVSGRQFSRIDLVKVVENALSETGLSANLLILELTETTLVQNPEAAVVVLKELKQMGVHIAIDDFGTGYSSLNYLKRFPIDAMKIDRSFVSDITMNPNDAAIVGAIIAMAHSLCLKVVAEGVESQQQLEFLKMIKCDDVQGYLLGKPIPPEEFPAAVASLNANRFNETLQICMDY